MKTGTQVEIDVISLLRIPEIESEITGGLWHNFMLANDLINIVVSCTSLTNQQIQQANVNINIHAPTIQIIKGGKSGRLPDLATFHRLSSLILPFLDAQYKPSFWTEITDPGLVLRTSSDSYYYNIRLKYRSIQTNYKNI